MEKYFFKTVTAILATGAVFMALNPPVLARYVESDNFDSYHASTYYSGNGGNCDRNPHAYAGPDKDVNANGTVRLEGTADGDYDRVSWSCDGGTLSNSASLEPTWRESNNYYRNDGYESRYGYDYNNDDYYDRTYNCTMTVRGNCGSDSDTMVIHARRSYRSHDQGYSSNSSMRVALIASPKTGCGPMYGVDLTATVYNYGNNRRGFTYYFDCENDGIWEKTVTSDEPFYTAQNICNYNYRTSFTARVRVEGQGRTLTDTDIINAKDCGNDNYYSDYRNRPYYPVQNQSAYTVYPSAYPAIVGPLTGGQVNIQKLVSNVTDGTQYFASVNADPLDIVSYKIIVTGISGISRGVTVTDALPAAISGVRDLRIDGVVSSGSIASGINIGDVSAGQTKTITFTATVAGKDSFSYGRTALTNAATVYAGGSSASARATVNVNRSGIQGATAVSTGFEKNIFAGIGISLAGIVLSLGWLLGRFLREKKINREELLARKIEMIRGK